MVSSNLQMHTKPTFSVIIPVYKGADTISKAIDSVRAQTYPAFELIVVDDGSTDATAEVVTIYGDPVRYLYQHNTGVSAARNAGATVAKGEWLAFLDADDWYYPDRLWWHAQWIKRDPHLDFLTGNFDYRKPDGSLIRQSMQSTEIGSRLLHKSTGKNEVVMEGDEIGDFIEQHFGDTHTLSLSRQTFLDLGGYPVDFDICEDVHLLIRLCAMSRRVGVICQPMAAYTIHSNSATRSNPLRAQKQTVEVLVSLRKDLANASHAVLAGIDGALRRARLSMAYVFLRSGRHLEAVGAVLPLLLSHPGGTSLRDVLSIVRGYRNTIDEPKT